MHVSSSNIRPEDLAGHRRAQVHLKPQKSPNLAGDGSMSCYDNHELATICRYANLGRTVCRHAHARKTRPTAR